jgi:hypothetical protein
MDNKPPSIEACLDKPADAPLPDRRARGMVSSDKMIYWHERAMRAEAMLVKLVDALEHKNALHPVFVEARGLVASGFASPGLTLITSAEPKP